MNRLQAELHRLYAVDALDATGSGAAHLADAHGLVRTMVLELGKPADWGPLAKVWQGVQAEFNLPAPAIAINGADGYQLWFSLAQALPADQAADFVKALCAHYLRDVSPQRLGMLPAADRLAIVVPPQERSADQWSAFVAPDLAPVFSDTPWLDVPPSPDGQADLLSRLSSIQPADLQAAVAQLTPTTTASDDSTMKSGSRAMGRDLGPKRFLLDVMNNETVALNLRIEAAKALLPYFDPKP